MNSETGRDPKVGDEGDDDGADAGFHERLKQLVGSEEPFAWAKRIGIPSGTFARIWNGRSIPKAPHLARIRRATGVSLDWLLTGDDVTGGPGAGAGAAAQKAERQPSPPTGPIPLDAELLARLMDGVARVYKDANARISSADQARVVAPLYDEIVATIDDPVERRGAAGLALNRLRQELQRAAEHPTETKRLA